MLIKFPSESEICIRFDVIKFTRSSFFFSNHVYYRLQIFEHPVPTRGDSFENYRKMFVYVLFFSFHVRRISDKIRNIYTLLSTDLYFVRS